MSFINKFRWVMVLILIFSVALNLYLWKEKRQVQQYWLSRNVTLIGADISHASSSIQSILTGSLPKDFQFGMALRDLQDASMRSKDASSNLADPMNSKSWNRWNVAFDQSFVLLTQIYGQFSNNQALTDTQVKQMQDIKALLDEFMKALRNPNNNFNTGYVDESAMKNAERVAEEFEKKLQSK